ncbi:hypothetical protein HELRODRAFT_191180 [Helobdella robusta]|uniref:Lethal giant larvae homologue 2 domain-containing protein n=1 Tax=Helobdella robusta TaxID=6412 RepID=T1FSP9_HELRO|nr:hypothetical protein HELRODRAFT_191180 [Helobdella robusta]ESO07421.1 hypothetical protein HELRODRAFT_191180 [Helobdella robusta]
MNSMLRRLRLKKEKKESEARQKLKKELFAVNKGPNFGFPSKPTCLTYDPLLSLIAIGTKTGKIRVYGSPGVELSGQFDRCISVEGLKFVSGQARLVALTSDNRLSIWEIDVNVEDTQIKCLHILSLKDCKLDDAFNFEISPSGNNVMLVGRSGCMQMLKFLIGFNSGLIAMWDCSKWRTVFHIRASVAMEQVSFSPDGLEMISCHVDGSYVVWQCISTAAAATATTSATTTTTTAATASTTQQQQNEQPTCPYGPFPCKAIHSARWLPVRSGDTFVIFTGGMPKAGHQDKNTISVMNNSYDHVVFDMTSRIIDYVIICSGCRAANGSNSNDDDDDSDDEETFALVILTEEEIVLIDLLSCNWPTFDLPYLHCIQSNPILCSHYSSNVKEVILDSLHEYEQFKIRASPFISSRPWPLSGGLKVGEHGRRGLLMFGHENGSVSLWCHGKADGLLRKIYTLDTSKYFTLSSSRSYNNNNKINSNNQNGDDDEDDDDDGDDDDDDVADSKKKADGFSKKRVEDDDQDWPPFRKVGVFDAFCDEPQFGIQHVSSHNQGSTLICTGNAGQIMIFEYFDRSIASKGKNEKKVALDDAAAAVVVQTSTLDIVEESSGYSWTGHAPMTFRGSWSKFMRNVELGYRLTNLIQLNPPVPTTSLAYHSKTKLLSVGTMYGYAVFDLLQNKSILTRRTLASPGSNLFHLKTKSLHKSFRESFRKLKRKKLLSTGSGGPCTRGPTTGSKGTFTTQQQGGTGSGQSPRLSAAAAAAAEKNLSGSSSQVLQELSVASSSRLDSPPSSSSKFATTTTAAAAVATSQTPPPHYHQQQPHSSASMTLPVKQSTTAAAAASTATTSSTMTAAVAKRTNRRRNSDTQSNPELIECSSSSNNNNNNLSSETNNNNNSNDNYDYYDDDDDEGGAKRMTSRKSTPSRSATVPSTQKLVRPKRVSHNFRKSNISKSGGASGGGAFVMEEPKLTEVKCLTFAETYLVSGAGKSLTLWAGTSAGTIYIHQLQVSRDEKKKESQVSCCLAKEITFKHRSPVMQISVLDKTMRPVSRCDYDYEVEVDGATAAASAACSGGAGHSVVVATQEQFKLFLLPSLKPACKYNLTSAGDHQYNYAANVASFISRSDENYMEHNLVCLTTTNQLLMFNLPHLKIQLKVNNVTTDASMPQCNIITNNGEVGTFSSTSELQWISLSTRFPLYTRSIIQLRTNYTRPTLNFAAIHHQQQQQYKQFKTILTNVNDGSAAASAATAATTAAAKTGSHVVEDGCGVGGSQRPHDLVAGHVLASNQDGAAAASAAGWSDDDDGRDSCNEKTRHANVELRIEGLTTPSNNNNTQSSSSNNLQNVTAATTTTTFQNNSSSFSSPPTITSSSLTSSSPQSRHVTSNRTVITRSTVVQEVNGQVMSHVATDVERMSMNE